ncbi:hypothetical protein BH09PLA1_BH09PLA1_07380 [soil metagenome]
MRKITLIVSLIVLCCTVHSFAWCYKEHIQFARLAAERLIADPATSPDMKAWLEQAVPKRFDLAGEKDYFLHAHLGLKPTGYETGLLHWAYDPDVHALTDPKESKIEPFAAHERLMHFIDLEYFLPGATPRAYKPDLSGKPKLAEIPNDPSDPRYIQAGYLPLRVAQVYGELVKSIREHRLNSDDPANNNHATYWAGYLAHYAADNTQSQHATIDYKSQSYFKNSRKAPNVHAAVEYLMCDDEKDYPALRNEFWPLFESELSGFSDPVKTDDLFSATLEVAMQSYDALPLIGQAAAAATSSDGKLDVEKFFRYRGKVDGQEMSVMEMKARQTAWAVKRIERIWKQAWVEANKR